MWLLRHSAAQMYNILKFNYLPSCFLVNAFKNGPLIVCNVPSFRNETKRKIYCINMIRKRKSISL